MEKVEINTTSKKYNVFIEKGLIDKVGRIIIDTLGKRKICIITDDNVDRLYSDRVIKSLADAGLESVKFVFPNGENHKTVPVWYDMIKFMSENSISRTDVVLALGGGIPGDMGGFAAATYLRGIKFIQVPTTLLADVDSSVGGKTAANLPAGKNLVGAFHQPEAVICDPDTLNSLPSSVFSDGCAEVIKYGVIQDREFFDFLERNDIKENIEYVIKRCVELKRDCVNLDETETGIRAILNFGHTAAHGIEKNSDFTVSHGSAVAIGMVVESRGLYKTGRCKEDYSNKISDLLIKNGLSVKCDYSADELFESAHSDKKRTGSKIKLINLKSLGKAFVKKIDIDDLLPILKAGVEN